MNLVHKHIWFQTNQTKRECVLCSRTEFLIHNIWIWGGSGGTPLTYVGKI
jgi:hypothetical protein